MGAKIVALVLPLCLDTFAVSTALGVARPSSRQRLRTSVLFASFEGLMPLVGLAAGRPLGNAIGAPADYLAIGVHAGLALHLVLSSREEPSLAELRRRGPLGMIALGSSAALAWPPKRA